MLTIWVQNGSIYVYIVYKEHTLFYKANDYIYIFICIYNNLLIIRGGQAINTIPKFHFMVMNNKQVTG
jgi:hypothetical protein